MTKSQRTFRRKLNLLLLTIAMTASSSGGEQNALSARIIWQVELDDTINERHFIHSIFEPDVGISSDLTRGNPVRMAATFRSVYLFDDQGTIEKKIPLKRDTIPNDVGKHDTREFTREYAITAPGGQFYLIQTRKSQGYSSWIHDIRAYNADGSMRFALDINELLVNNKLVSCRRDSFTKSFDFREDGIRRSRPHERVCVGVPLGGVAFDALDEL